MEEASQKQKGIEEEGKFEFPPSIHFNARKLISQFLQ
jgi:hypothetical protein